MGGTTKNISLPATPFEQVFYLCGEEYSQNRLLFAITQGRHTIPERVIVDQTEIKHMNRKINSFCDRPVVLKRTERK